MSQSVVAYRYAKSLIDLATQKGVVEEVNQDMGLFKEVSNSNKEFLKVMGNPIVRHDKKLKILKSIFENRVHPVTFSIFDILTRKNRENLIYSIAEEFQKLYNKHNGIQRATVTTVEPLTPTQRAEFIRIVTDATGMKVVLEEKTNPNLIGGYVITVDDTQLDTSVRKRLRELQLALH